jgi:predicted acetyltransferase
VAVELRPARESDRPRVEVLLGAYLRELDAYEPPLRGDDDPARFSYPYLPLYWSDADRHPFLISSEGETVGFVFVREELSEATVVRHVAEFYVVPASRRLGVGQSAALALWKRFPGRWQLQVHCANAKAVRFWRSCVDRIAKVPPRVSEIRVRESKRLQFDWVVE